MLRDKVYVVIYQVDYEDSNICNIFKEESKAKEHVEALNQGLYSTEFTRYYYEPWEVE